MLERKGQGGLMFTLLKMLQINDGQHACSCAVLEAIPFTFLPLSSVCCVQIATADDDRSNKPLET